MRGFLQAACGTLAVIALFLAWYYIAANYDYAALAGTYVFHENGETCTLYLHSDRTFAQELNRSGETKRSLGHWHRSGESGVSFSNEFQKLSGEEMSGEGHAVGQFEKLLGIFPRLVLDPLPDGPTFRKRWLL
jgi:hypothetical protein